MEFRGLETVVIDLLRSPELQRLRRVRHLGLAPWVFPGAEHSRFAHALGSAYVAILFGRRLADDAHELLPHSLCPNESAIRDVAVAALCHDIGHGPLSHAWEHLYEETQYDQAEWIDRLGLAEEADEMEGLKWHELVTQGFLIWDQGALHQILEAHEAGFSARIRNLLRGSYYLPYLSSLLSGDIDVDRADYLLRDAHGTGVGYGWFNLEWLVSVLEIGEHEERAVVGLNARKGMQVATEFLVGRSGMYDAVYYHKTVRAAEGMVRKLLERLQAVSEDSSDRARISSVLPWEFSAAITGRPMGPEELLRLHDDMLWRGIEAIATSDSFDPVARDLAIRLLDRDLFKQVDVSEEQLRSLLDRPTKRDQIAAWDALEAAVEPYVRFNPGSYLLIDTASYTTLGTQGYFIDDRVAVPFSTDAFRDRLVTGSRTVRRLYTTREAVNAVAEVVRSPPSS